ncbi:MAG: 1-acyl-sn-glycerol-3-phosphate acyltransferase [Candidatus Makaraimicrobium thalassicum]|nr:MAG: 1-acyl-sn-glycerol-3-phosphate acyltransferase [Candidatus Omnitrophota bacterium]
MPYRISRFILEVFLRFFFKVRIFGRENIPDPPYIVVPNHTSLLDPPLVGMACKKDSIDFMAKEELFDKRVVGAWTRSVRCIPVSRRANSTGSLKEALKRVSRGRSICIFPEGTRSVDGRLQAAKRGVGFLIERAGVPVVPVYIEGSTEALPKGGRLKPGTRIDVFVGKPVLPGSLIFETASGKRDYESITNAVMGHIKDIASFSEKG